MVALLVTVRQEPVAATIIVWLRAIRSKLVAVLVVVVLVVVVLPVVELPVVTLPR